MKSIFSYFFAILLSLVVSAIDGLLTGWFVMLLWNALLPDLFGFPVISILQAIGLSILCSFLFRKVVSTAKN